MDLLMDSCANGLPWICLIWILAKQVYLIDLRYGFKQHKIVNFSSLAPSALAECLQFVGGGAREKRTLCEKTLLVHFEYLRTHAS